MEGFRERLRQRQLTVGSYLCVGFDPVIEKMPASIKEAHESDAEALYAWMVRIAKATLPFASMAKASYGCWAAIENGTDALKMFIEYLHERWPNIPILDDCKCGDTLRSQRQNRIAHFERLGVDGVTYNPYMGPDTLLGLIETDHPERALVGLGRASNPGAWIVQDARMQDRRAFWEHIVQQVHEWSAIFGVLKNAGVTMGAAHNDPEHNGAVYARHLSLVKRLYGDALWLLILGIGEQGGLIEETARVIRPEPGNCAFNVSSAINFASSGSDFAEAAGAMAKKYRDDFNRCT
jgi:orotidine-5'-phosphate decarboxylase